MSKKTPKTIDDYISLFPTEVQTRLEQIRAAIRKTAPEAEERISYGIPSFALEGSLVWFAAFKHHIGFYPRPSGITAFQKELTPYKQARGSVQFPLDKPLPLGLVSRIVKFRVKENLSKKK
jgi:uncharacterized protein YdhG (YjbR/CyaY superfamily)